MGRLINADVLREEVNSWGMNDYEPSDFTDAIDDAPTVEAISKADYEARLKADMVAMLEKLKSEIDNMPKYYPYTDHSRWYIDGDVFGLIQQKIDALKGENNGIHEN